MFSENECTCILLLSSNARETQSSDLASLYLFNRSGRTHFFRGVLVWEVKSFSYFILPLLFHLVYNLIIFLMRLFLRKYLKNVIVSYKISINNWHPLINKYIFTLNSTFWKLLDSCKTEKGELGWTALTRRIIILKHVDISVSLEKLAFQLEIIAT